MVISCANSSIARRYRNTLIAREKKALAETRAAAFLRAMEQLGYGREEIVSLLRENKEVSE